MAANERMDASAAGNVAAAEHRTGGREATVLVWSKAVVGGLFGLSCMTIFLPLFVPLGFGGWLENRFPALRNVSNWVVVPLCYAYFVLLMIFLSRARRWYAFLAYLLALAGSTAASFSVLDNLLGFPTN